MLLDSNIIIYAAQPEHDALRKFIFEHPNYGGECSRKALLKIVTMPALWINTMIPRRAMIRVKTVIYGKDSKTRTCRFDGWIRKKRSFCLASYEVRSWKENPWNRTGKLFASASRSGANVT